MDGIVVHDIVTAIGGTQVTSLEELVSIIEAFDVGDIVPITVQRIGADGHPSLITLNVRTF